MKKILPLILFLLLFIPINLKAREGIDNFYIDATILENGDIKVRELSYLNGSFNGFERIINYRGLGTINDIYNGDDIVINSVEGVDINDFSKGNNTFNFSKSDIFSKVTYANSGEYGKYIENDSYYGKTLRIYNQSSKKGFYIDYTIVNAGIIHNDIAEVGLNIFDQLTEYVENFEMYIHIPNNQELLRTWAHGPLHGNIEIIDNQTVKVTIKGLEPNTPIDVRLAFDKDAIQHSTKTTSEDALDGIIAEETVKADEANRIREQARNTIFISHTMNIIWIVILFVIIFHIYRKYDKEYKSEFTGKYYREFPNDYEPSTVGYLIRKNINTDDLSASLLNLIYKKIVTFEPITGKKNDYLLKYDVKDNVLTESEDKLIDFIFGGQEITLSELKKKANKNYDSFIKKYTTWKNTALNEAVKQDFFENQTTPKTLSILYSVLGLTMGFSLMGYAPESSFLTIIGGIGSLIYFATFKRRTNKGNNDYTKWIGLKSFMEDFGRMDKKDLPEIVLWEKYLVYAVTLGCANKLSKTMEIKVKEFTDYNSNDLIFDYYRFNTLMSFNRIMHNSVNNSVNSAYSARSAAQSSNSSGSGFGGGFSGGGGSFGGGGGGGRF